MASYIKRSAYIAYIKRGAAGPKWVRLKRYCELTGDTPDAVHARRKRGIWIDGVQCKLGPDGHIWINLEGVDQWIEQKD
jgi:hypothetical protein